MAKLTRKTQKIFCNANIAAPADQIAQFGSLKEGTPVFSSDPDTIQNLSAYADGWKGAVKNNNSPALQDVNALDYLFTRQLAYLFEAGLAEYDAATTYFKDCLVRVGSRIYRSLIDTNLNQSVSDATKWGMPPGTVPVGGMVATMPNTAGAWSPAFSGSIKDGFMRADGAVISAQNVTDGSVIPQGTTLPNMVTKYPRGNTTSGTMNGSNVQRSNVTVAPITLSASHIPRMSVSGGIGASNVNHTHSASAGPQDFDHGHRIDARFSLVLTPGSRDFYDFGKYDTSHATVIDCDGTTRGQDTGHTHAISVWGPSSTSHSHGFSGTVGYLSPNSFTPALANNEVNNEPAYVEVVWVIRVY